MRVALYMHGVTSIRGGNFFNLSKPIKLHHALPALDGGGKKKVSKLASPIFIGHLLLIRAHLGEFPCRSLSKYESEMAGYKLNFGTWILLTFFCVLLFLTCLHHFVSIEVTRVWAILFYFFNFSRIIKLIKCLPTLDGISNQVWQFCTAHLFRTPAFNLGSFGQIAQ